MGIDTDAVEIELQILEDVEALKSKKRDITVNSTPDGIQEDVATTASEMLASELVIAGGGKGFASASIDLLTKYLANTQLTVGEKVGELQKIQNVLLAPMLEPLFCAEEFDLVKDKKAKYANDMFYILDDVIEGIYKKSKFEEKEEIDFLHPKVQKAFEFIVAAVLESMKEVQVDPILINNFVSNFALKMVGFEAELTAKMRGVSGAALNKLNNPLMEKYRKEKSSGEKEG